MASERNDEDRLFIRDGWRHYRRTYSLAEVRWGLVTLGVMVAIGVWVAWRKNHPADPNLFADGTALLKPAASGEKVPVATALPKVSPSHTAAPAAPVEEGAIPGASRGPLPTTLAGPGWKEDKVAQFDEENLYVKIDGRADYFRAFAFRRLYSAVLINEKDESVSIDVEMYDLANAANALGAYGGERPPDAQVQVTTAGLHHFSRNAVFFARGRYYIRVIGSDETPLIHDKLEQLAQTLIAGVPGEPLPWAYGLFLGQMKFSADKITYSAKNAFSLAFADDVWAVRPRGKENDLEIFVSVRDDAKAARQMADKLRASFLELGQAAGKAGGLALVKDQFLGLFSAASSSDRFVIGVRGAADKKTAVDQIDGLRAALKAAPADLLAQARPQKTEAAADKPAPASGPGPGTPTEAADEK
jgi:hypothetical protein